MLADEKSHNALMEADRLAQEVADANDQQVVCAESLAEKEAARDQKLHEGYLLGLQSHHVKILASLAAWLKTAEAEYAKHEERIAQARLAASQLNEWCLRKQGLLADDEWTKYALAPRGVFGGKVLR